MDPVLPPVSGLAPGAPRPFPLRSPQPPMSLFISGADQWSPVLARPQRHPKGICFLSKYASGCRWLLSKDGSFPIGNPTTRSTPRAGDEGVGKDDTGIICLLDVKAAAFAPRTDRSGLLTPVRCRPSPLTYMLVLWSVRTLVKQEHFEE